MCDTACMPAIAEPARRTGASRGTSLATANLNKQNNKGW